MKNRTLASPRNNTGYWVCKKRRDVYDSLPTQYRVLFLGAASVLFFTVDPL